MNPWTNAYINIFGATWGENKCYILTLNNTIKYTQHGKWFKCKHEALAELKKI